MNRHIFTVGKLHFVTRATFSTGRYSVHLFGPLNEKLAYEKGWGYSGCDALDAAAYYKDPSRAHGLIAFLFSRIDGYVDRPGILDLWLASTYERKIP